MSTLSNVQEQGSEASFPGVGLAPDTIPEAKCSRAGVSVRYVHDPDKRWYVLRASYGREEKASDALIMSGEFTYVPKRNVDKRINGKLRHIQEVLVPNLIFAYLTAEKAEEYVHGNSLLSFLSYYYNHFELIEGKNPPLTIPHKEMQNFIKLTSIDNKHIRRVLDSQCHYKNGDYVEIIDGAFVGVRGRVARVAGQQRVVVNLHGVCTIATAYIPTAFLRTLNDIEATETA